MSVEENTFSRFADILTGKSGEDERIPSLFSTELCMVSGNHRTFTNASLLTTSEEAPSWERIFFSRCAPCRQLLLVNNHASHSNRLTYLSRWESSLIVGTATSLDKA